MSASSPSRSSPGRSTKVHPGSSVVVAVAPPLSLAARENNCTSALFLPDYGSLIRHAVIRSQQDAFNVADFENFCAEKVQCVFRMFRERRTYKRTLRAILSVQRIFRAYVARNRVKRLQEKDELTYVESCFHYYASRIQAVFRGYYSRKYVDDYYARRAYIFSVAARSDEVLQDAIHQRLVSDKEDAEAQQKKEKAAYTKATEQVHFILSTVGCSGVYRRWPLDDFSRVELQGGGKSGGRNLDGSGRAGKLQAMPFQTSIEDDIRKNAQRKRRDVELLRVTAHAKNRALPAGNEKGLTVGKCATEVWEEGKEVENLKDRGNEAHLTSSVSPQTEKMKKNYFRPTSKAISPVGLTAEKRADVVNNCPDNAKLHSELPSDLDAEDAFEKVYTSKNFSTMTAEGHEAVESDETEEEFGKKSTKQAKTVKEGMKKAVTIHGDNRKRGRLSKGVGKAHPMHDRPAEGNSIRKIHVCGDAMEKRSRQSEECLLSHQFPTSSTATTCDWENSDVLPPQRPMISPQDCCTKSTKQHCVFSASFPLQQMDSQSPSLFTSEGGRGVAGEASRNPALSWNTFSSFSRAYKGVAHDCLLPPLVESTYNTESARLEKSVDRLYKQHLHQGNVFKVSYSSGKVPLCLPAVHKISMKSSSAPPA